MRKLLVATRNKGKALEVARILEHDGWEIVSLEDFPEVPEVEETGLTYADNAAIKAKFAAAQTGLTAIADDSGLEVDALDGAPGINSSRLASTDAERISKLLKLLEGVPIERRSARFRCAIAIAKPDGQMRICEGTVEGIIANEPKGERGFGYDPVFYLPELGRHMAELDPEEKDRVSHRGRALRRAKEILEEF